MAKSKAKQSADIRARLETERAGGGKDAPGASQEAVGVLSRNKARQSGMPLWGKLLLVYLAFVALRFALSLSIVQRLLVSPDELVYLNIAKSLFLEGRVAFDGYYINYSNILYPLLIAPLYALPESISVFQAIQLFNAFLINASLFPLFALAKRVTGKESVAWTVALVGLILPDMLLSHMVLVESLLFPLFYLAVYLGYRALTEDGGGWAYLLAIVAVLLYVAKISMMMIGIGLMFVVALDACLRRDRARIVRAVLGILLAAALVAFANWGTSRLIGVAATGVTQGNYYTGLMTKDLGAGILKVLSGCSMYLFLFPVGCAVLPFVTAISGLKRYAPKERLLLVGVLIGMVLTAMGASYTTFIRGNTGILVSGRISLRYVAPFLPILLAYSLSDSVRDLRYNACSYSLMGYLVLGSFLITPLSICASGMIDNLLLSFTYPGTENGLRMMITIFAAVLVLGGAVVLFKVGWTRKVRRVTLGVLICMLVAQSIYPEIFLTRIVGSRTVFDDAAEVSVWANERESGMALATKFPFGYDTMALYAHCRGYMPTVNQHELYNHLAPDGSYVPFYQQSYFDTVKIDRPTPEGFMIIDAHTRNLMDFAEGVETRTTSNEYYTLVDIPKDGPLLRSAVAGHTSRRVENNALLFVYDPAIVNAGNAHLELHLAAENPDTPVIIGSCTVPRNVVLDGYDLTLQYYAKMRVTDEYEWFSGEVPIYTKEDEISVVVLQCEDRSMQLYIDEYSITAA